MALLGRDLYADDIVLSGARLEKSCAPGYLGAQAGRGAGRVGVDWDQWHYQFNDLGTVLATTDADGLKIGVYAPDAFGNERLVDGLRPDGLMLTGKFRDAMAGLIYFGHRWYDAKRGRWMSEEPLGLDGPNMYHFVFNAPYNNFDADGLKARRHRWGNWLILVPDIDFPFLDKITDYSLGILYGTANATTQIAPKVWKAPNTALAVGIGAAGLPLGGDKPYFDDGKIIFGNCPLVPNGTALTPGGDAQLYGGDITIPSLFPGEANITIDPLNDFRGHEDIHSLQGSYLGPLFLPAYGLGGLIGVSRSGSLGGFFDENNPLEAGPYANPRRTWPHLDELSPIK